ncbi:MAG: TlpA disulfide reductase family protein, partial [Myxococcota bacterium]
MIIPFASQLLLTQYRHRIFATLLLFVAWYPSANAAIPHPYFSKYPKAEQQLDALMRQAKIQPVEPQPANLSISLLDVRKAQLYNLSKHRGQVILLSRWATWCSACKAELPSKIEMWKQLKNPKLTLLGVSEESRETVRSFEQGRKQVFPISLVDTTNAVQRFYPSKGLPTTILIDPWGWVIGMKVGGLQWTQPSILALLRYLLSMKPSTPRNIQIPPPQANFA